jgi:gliding motility-associated-like protein
VLCNGDDNGTATAIPGGGTAPYSFLWDNAANSQTTATASNLTAGNYTVTVTDDNECVQTISIQVGEPAALSLSSSFEDPNCFDSTDGTIEIIASGGTPAYNYTWSDNTLPNDPSPDNLAAGSYTLTLTDANGCEISETIVLTNPAPIVLNIQQTDVSCFGGNDGTASAMATGIIGTPAYNWSNGSTSAENNNLAAGAYCLTISDDNGCEAEDCINIDQPTELVLSLLPDNVSCDDTDDGAVDLMIQGGVPPYGYLWSNNATDEDLIDLTTGNYAVTVTDDNDCEIQAATTVAQSEPSFSLDFTSISPQCFGESTGSIDLSIINPTNTFSYQWSGNNVQSAEQDLTGIPAGTYEVVVEDADGCEVVGTVELDQPTILAGNLTVADVSCFGLEDGSILVEGSGGTTPYLFSADNGLTFQDAPIFTSMAAGSYEVVIQDAQGCEYSETFTISEPDEIVITLQPIAEICLGDSYTVNASINIPDTQIDTIIWSPLDSLSCIDCLSFQASPTFTTAYSLQVNSTDGCVAESQLILIVDRRVNVYVPNAFSPNEDGVNDGFMVFAKSNIRQIKSLQVYSRWGEQVFSADNFPPNDPTYSWDGTLNGEAMNPAVFTWIMEIELLDGAIEKQSGNVMLIR